MTTAATPRPRPLRFSWLDFRVGFRILARFPGLTLVGTAAIAVAIALSSVYFEAINKWQNPTLPIRDADRVVSIRNWDASAARPEAARTVRSRVGAGEVRSPARAARVGGR